MGVHAENHPDVDVLTMQRTSSDPGALLIDEAEGAIPPACHHPKVLMNAFDCRGVIL